jgi:hypothetical protein
MREMAFHARPSRGESRMKCWLEQAKVRREERGCGVLGISWPSNRRSSASACVISETSHSAILVAQTRLCSGSHLRPRAHVARSACSACRFRKSQTATRSTSSLALSIALAIADFTLSRTYARAAPPSTQLLAPPSASSAHGLRHNYPVQKSHVAPCGNRSGMDLCRMAKRSLAYESSPPLSHDRQS